MVRALADCAAAATLGLAVVPMLDTGRLPGASSTPRAGCPLGWAAGLWLFTELCRLVVGAAAAAAVPVSRVGLTTTAEFATATSAGRSGLFSVAAAGLVLVVALAAPGHRPQRSPPPGSRRSGWSRARSAATCRQARSAPSRSRSTYWPPRMWCGTLAALVLTVDHRGQWARVLPRFSELSLLCVIALLAGGVTGALVAVDSASQLFATGYGRVLLIKIVLTVVLMALAWRNRARWLPAAKSHRVTAYVSRSRSLTELAIMAVALTMAAALSVTG